MGRRCFRRVWHVIAALVPLPLIGAGYVAGVPGNQMAFRIELMLSGKGSEYALSAAPFDAAHPHRPLPSEAAALFRTSAKGPRADHYLALASTTNIGKHFVTASLDGSAEVTGSVDQSHAAGRAAKGDRLTSGVTEVALRSAADTGISGSLLMTPAYNPLAFEGMSDTPAPPPESIAYHPSTEGLSFKSQGESEAEFEERERRCLATAIYFEARGEPVRGQIAVGQVIMNRVRSPQFPQTICGVVYQGQMQKGCQFSFACDGKSDMPKNDEQWALAQDLSKQITSGKVWLPEVGYSTYYHANSVRPGWVNAMNKIDSIGHHVFYKKRNEEPYVVEQDASAGQAASATTTAAAAPDALAAASSPTPISTALSLVSSISGTAAATPATGLGYAANE